MAGVPWIWPPSAVAPNVGWNLPVPTNIGAILVEVATGNSAVLCPAPPAGYANVLAMMRTKNLSAVSTVTNVVDNGAGIAIAGIANQNVSGVSNIVVSAEAWSTNAITVTVSGAGGPLQINGIYYRVPLSVMGRVQLVPFAITIGLAPVAVPQCVPPPGYGAVLLGACGIPASTAYDVWVLNRDSAVVTTIWRITRSGVVWESNLSSTTAVNGRGAQIVPVPTVLAGDTLEFHTLAAPVIANSVTMGGVFAFIPLVT